MTGSQDDDPSGNTHHRSGSRSLGERLYRCRGIGSDVAAYIRQSLAIASRPIEEDPRHRYDAILDQDAWFILINCR